MSSGRDEWAEEARAGSGWGWSETPPQRSTSPAGWHTEGLPNRFPYHSDLASRRWDRGYGSWETRSRNKVGASSLILFVCGILVMVGSVTAWVTVHSFGHTGSVTGTQLSGVDSLGIVNGWFTFTGGVALLVLGGLMVVSTEVSVRVLAILVALATLGFAIYVTWSVSSRPSPKPTTRRPVWAPLVTCLQGTFTLASVWSSSWSRR